MALSTQRASAFHPSADQSAPPQWNYDMFLSFRGVDTRNGILSHLYHELQNRCIKTFMDDPELERGTTISSELFKAIQESKLAIVVLSPNYASSSWCLDELTKILQCMKSNASVLPVFYNVDPSDVRKQSGSFASAFAEHEKRFGKDTEKVKRWRAALTEVANLSGFDSKNQCERKVVEKIVEWVWGKVHHTFKLLDSTELVGIKFTREQMDLLLDPTDDVRFVGIWGMGGIGKTTVARFVYESISFHFEVPCFLANVREASEGKKQADLFFPPDFADDFPVAMQMSHKYSLIYVITKLGLLFVYDLETAGAVYRNRISPDPIFLTTEASSVGGFYAVNRRGQVLLATINEQTIVPFVSGQE